MAVVTKKIKFSTKGETDIIDITSEAQRCVSRSKLTQGVVTVFVPGATGGITTIEYEPGLVKDLKELLDKIAPRSAPYAHNISSGDGNGYSHMRASLLGPSLTVPFSGGNLTLGRWQQIIFIDFDNRPRDRELIVQIMGE